MRPRLLAYAQDIGVARVLLPVLRRLRRERGFRLTVLGSGQATEVLRGGGVACTAIESLWLQLPLTDRAADRLLREMAPDLFLAGASHYRDPTNARLVTACRRQGVRTVALLDHWKNLNRFGGPRTGGFAFAPDLLGVTDDVTKSVLQDLGLAGSRMAVVGHPYLQEIHATRRRLLSSRRIRALRRRAGIAGDALLVLCCSEMLHAHGPSSPCTGRCRALFEVEEQGTALLDRVHDTVRDVEARVRRACTVALRPHPFEVSRPIRGVSASISRMDHRVCSDVEAVAAADVIVGVSSMPLIQAHVLGKPVVSLQLPCVVARQRAYSSRTAWAWDSRRTFLEARSFDDLGLAVERAARGRRAPAALDVPTKALLRDATGRAVRLLRRAASQGPAGSRVRAVGKGL